MTDFQRVRVVSIQPAAEGIRHLVLDDAPFAALHELPGQYVVMRLPDGRRAYFARLSSPGDPYAEYLLGKGAVAEAIAQLGEGDYVESSAPEGKGFDLTPARGLDLLLVGTGTGLGPLRSLMGWLAPRRAEFGTLELVYGARTPAHIPLREELERFRLAGIRQHIVYSRHGDEPGYVQDYLRRRGGDLSRTAIVAVGQKEMTLAMKEHLPVFGLDPARVLMNF